MAAKKTNGTENLALEAQMTPEEAALYRSFQALIGKPLKDARRHDLFLPLLDDGEVRRSVIQKWAMVTGDTNPLWTDDAYASRSRWGTVTAPPLFMLTVYDGADPCAYFVKELLTPSPVPIINLEKYPNFRGAMQAGCDWEFFQPLRPGDRITAESVPTEIYWKQGQRMRLLFTYGETEYWNQDGEKVVWNRIGSVFMFKAVDAPGGAQ
jgi:acyl dehydratase